MQDAKTRLEAAGTRFSPEVWRHISPASYGRINFKGILDFPLDRYAGRLMIDAPAIVPSRIKL
jgi:hypothetical protein